MPYDYEEREEYEPWEKDSMKFSVGIENIQEEIFVTAIARELADRISTRMIKKIETHVEETIAVKLTERVDSVVEDLVSKGMQSHMQPSDQFSNPKGDPLTMTDFIAQKAEGYLQETVNDKGEPCASSPYGGRTSSRMSHMMSGVIDKAFEKEVSKGVADIKNDIRGQMQKAAAEWLAKFQAETVTGIENAKALAIRSQ